MLKRILILVATLIVIAFSGCVAPTKDAAGNVVPAVALVRIDKAVFAAKIIRPLAQGGSAFFLNKNPSYAPALGLLADALPAALGAGDLSPTGIAATISVLNERKNLGISEDAQALIATLLSTGIGEYQQEYGAEVASLTDPGVALMLQAFAQGLHDGVSGWEASHK